MPWSEDEHHSFLLGLEHFGKGEWRSISRHFVISRTPSQVASHAQKYFKRQGATRNSAPNRRRRSIHDIPLPSQNPAYWKNVDLPRETVGVLASAQQSSSEARQKRMVQVQLQSPVTSPPGTSPAGDAIVPQLPDRPGPMLPLDGSVPFVQDGWRIVLPPPEPTRGPNNIVDPSLQLPRIGPVVERGNPTSERDVSEPGADV